MTTITFDTRQAVRNLQAAGFAEAQADAVVDTLAGAFSDTVATKTDIAEVKTEIAEVKTESPTQDRDRQVKSDLKAETAAVRADIDKLEASSKADIAGVKADLKIIKYFFGPAIILLLLKIAFF